MKNIPIFKNCLQNETWDLVYLTNDIESAYDRFQGVLDQLLNSKLNKMYARRTRNVFFQSKNPIQ